MKIITTLILCAATQVALAQAGQTNRHDQNDPLFPVKGRFHAGILSTYTNSTPPPALIGDVTYGISNKLSAGIVVGTTGALAVYGLKFNAILFQRKQFRLGYRMVTVYYPERNGKFLFDRTNKHVMPWMLSMGVVDAEWRSKKGIRFSTGIGLLETHCVDGMMKLLRGSKERDNDDLPLEVFTTLQGSVSIPISKKLILRPEVFAVFKGTRLINKDEFKVKFPVNAFINLVYNF